MRSSDSGEVLLRREVLLRVVKAFLSGDFACAIEKIPDEMVSKEEGSDHAKRQAIIRDMVVAALGFSADEEAQTIALADLTKMALARREIDEKVLTVLRSACHRCGSEVRVTDLCQGCVARPCQYICRFGAMQMVDGHAKIDQSKCKKCKMCIAVCPYHAIVKTIVPCEESCPVGAISKDPVTSSAKIDYAKCISCGKCAAACPFGAIHEKSQLVDILRSLEAKDEVIALLAPSIAGQFSGNIFKLHTALLKLGFREAFEVALGADITTKREAAEFVERMQKGEAFMTTSCCAGYNNLVEKHLPEIAKFKSNTETPLFYTAELVRKLYPTAKIVFLSPCVAKRKEILRDKRADYLLNFEELLALLNGYEINVEACEELPFKDLASKQGRNFGVTGGVAAAVQSLNSDVKPYLINGLNRESVRDLKKMAKEAKCPFGNLVEVMCCEGGCINGNAAVKTPRDALKPLKQLLGISKEITEI